MPDTNFTPASWLTELIKNIQSAEDSHYATSGARADFERAKANWVTANIVNRDVGLPITPFTAPVPQKIVFYATGFDSYDQRNEPDPGATLPELPPPTPKLVATPIVTTAAQKDAQLNQVLGLILSKLVSLESLLKAK